MKAFITFLLFSLAFLGGACAQKPEPKDTTIIQEHFEDSIYIPAKYITMLKVNYSGPTTEIEEVILCSEDYTAAVTITNDSVFVNLGGVEIPFKVAGSGSKPWIVYLEDGTGVPTVMYLFHDKKSKIVIFQKETHVTRLSQHKIDCNGF